MQRLKTRLKPACGKLDIIAIMDVILLLLIFFLLNSSLVFQRGINITPIKTDNYSLFTARHMELVITSDKNSEGRNRMFFNDKELFNSKELEREIRLATQRIRKELNASNSKTTPHLAINYDSSTPIEFIGELSTLSKELNITVYILVDRKPDNSQQPELLDVDKPL